MSKKAKQKRKHELGFSSSAAPSGLERKPKIDKEEYEAEPFKLQVELVKLQDWMKVTNARIVIVLEGRDAAGTGGMIKRVLERVSPRIFRVVALPPPTDILSSVPYEEIPYSSPKLPPRQKRKGYVEPKQTHRVIPQRW